MDASTNPHLSRKAFLAAVMPCVAACALVLAGWRVFWFLTDDAYISFRYISNSVLGHGYVWNPPPFRPVEGYTNFLWILILDAIWRLLGITPPQSANVVSLLCTLTSVGVAASMVMRLQLPLGLQRVRLVLLALVLGGTATNLTFLTWASSGLETALFNALILLWVHGAVFGTRRPASLALVSSCAALLCLTRPDGLVFAGGTIVLAVLAAFVRARDGGGTGEPDAARSPRLRDGAALLPLMLVPAHFLWRFSRYGEWLPNTYYAKTAGVWPQSGWRYLTSFLLEYGFWIWIVAILAVLLFHGRRRRLDPKDARQRAACVASICLLVHGGYYTLVVGGDHFEYRVYSHLIPLIFVSSLWVLARSGLRAGAAVASLACFVLLTLPIPYTHWLKSRSLTTREETLKMRVPVAPAWPAPLRWYPALFDRQQAWLIERFVGVRHQEHKVNLAVLESAFPTREQGETIRDDDYPVLAFPAVGYAAWALPHINILDTHGLNDYVTARTPLRPGQQRHMAHDRQAPADYVQCFAPNVRVEPGRRVVIVPRSPPLRGRDIERCEERWAQWVRQRQAGVQADRPLTDP